jgi:hypothetical protein
MGRELASHPPTPELAIGVQMGVRHIDFLGEGVTQGFRPRSRL